MLGGIEDKKYTIIDITRYQCYKCGRRTGKEGFMKSLCVILTVFCICLFSAEGRAADWVYYTKDNLGNYKFYDRTSIRYSSKDVIRVLKKDVYSKNGIKDFVAQRAKNKLSTYGYDDLSHVLCKEEINCKTKEFRLLACSIYDKSGSIVENQSVPDGHQVWEPIQPGSDLDIFRKVLCKLPPKKAKTKSVTKHTGKR